MPISTNSAPRADQSMTRLTLPNRLQILTLGFIATVGGFFPGGDPKEDTPTNPEARSTNSLTMPKRPGADWKNCILDGQEAVVGTVEIKGKIEHFVVVGTTVSVGFCKNLGFKVGDEELAKKLLDISAVATEVKYETHNGGIVALTKLPGGHTEATPGAATSDVPGDVAYFCPKNVAKKLMQGGLKKPNSR
jgi:hypothetical protein